MRFLSRLAAVLVVGMPLAAQNEWVTNGDFTGTLAPWVMGGAYSVNPGLDSTYDTTGMGVSDSFGVNAGGQVTPPPYAPNWIEQTVLMIQGFTYEIRADVAGHRTSNPNVGNADIGTIWAEVDNVEVARFAFGAYTVGQTKRAQLCGRFTPTTTGNVTLRLYFQRAYLGGAANPRMNIDNVSIKDVVGPTYWISTNRRIGTNITFQVQGAPTASFATFISAGQMVPGVPFAGIGGLWHLDLLNTSMLVFGFLDANGAASQTLLLPNQAWLLTSPFYFQAATELGGNINFGHHFGVVMTQ